RTRHEQNYRTIDHTYKIERTLRRRIRLFLIGMLCGVITMATVTLVFAIPANDFRWRMEIFNRGGAAWIVDKDGRVGWKWLVEPKADNPRQKRVTVPASGVDARTERL